MSLWTLNTAGYNITLVEELRFEMYPGIAHRRKLKIGMLLDLARCTIATLNKLLNYSPIILRYIVLLP